MDWAQRWAWGIWCSRHRVYYLFTKWYCVIRAFCSLPRSQMIIFLWLTRTNLSIFYRDLWIFHFVIRRWSCQITYTFRLNSVRHKMTFYCSEWLVTNQAYRRKHHLFTTNAVCRWELIVTQPLSRRRPSLAEILSRYRSLKVISNPKTSTSPSRGVIAPKPNF